MNINNFTEDYTPPDITKEYKNSSLGEGTGFHLLHKLVWFPKLLREYKIDDPNVTTTKGWTALMIACRNGFTESVEILLKYPNIKVNLCTKDRWTALMMACRDSNADSNIEVVKLLLKHPDINVDLQNIDGNTALMFACGNINDDSNIETVELLLSMNADVNIIGDDEKKCIDAIISEMEEKYNETYEAIIERIIRKTIESKDESVYIKLLRNAYIRNDKKNLLNSQEGTKVLLNTISGYI
jgi:ankyrin repeat protein